MHQTKGGIPNKGFISNQTFEKNTEEILFKHIHTEDIKLDLKKAMFLDRCSTMNFSCNSDLVENIIRAGKNMRVQGNGGNL